MTHSNAPLKESFDPLQASYRETVTEIPAVVESLERRHTALLVVDLQYLGAAPGYGVFSHLPKGKVSKDTPEFYYFDQLERIILPNVQRLQAAFRANNLEVIHTRIQSLTKDGRDRGPQHKRLGLHAPAGSKEAEFLPAIAPQGDEIIIGKTASGVFNSTNLSYILRNLEITGLFVAGVYSNECVSTAIRDACDLGFFTTLIQDGCTTVTPELQKATLQALKDRYARVFSIDEAIAEINQVVAT